jgi:hypothetical protein
MPIACELRIEWCEFKTVICRDVLVDPVVFLGIRSHTNAAFGSEGDKL